MSQMPPIEEVHRQIDHLAREVVHQSATGPAPLVAVEVSVPPGWPEREVRALIERRLAVHGLDFVDVTGTSGPGEALELRTLSYAHAP